MTRPVRLLTELVGTFIFLSVIALSGPVGPLAPLPIGTAGAGIHRLLVSGEESRVR
jgi:hypothetical protein